MYNVYIYLVACRIVRLLDTYIYIIIYNRSIWLSISLVVEAEGGCEAEAACLISMQLIDEKRILPPRFVPLIAAKLRFAILHMSMYKYSTY